MQINVGTGIVNQQTWILLHKYPDYPPHLPSTKYFFFDMIAKRHFMVTLNRAKQTSTINWKSYHRMTRINRINLAQKKHLHRDTNIFRGLFFR
jgi:hypothetical protein